jgi:2-keto-4-pentenoate hydratase
MSWHFITHDFRKSPLLMIAINDTDVNQSQKRLAAKDDTGYIADVARFSESSCGLTPVRFGVCVSIDTLTASPSLAAIDASARMISGALVAARTHSIAMLSFPGVIPATLEHAYRVQDLAIKAWPDQIIGWKVGYIAAERRGADGVDRLIGPIFAEQSWAATNSDPTQFSIFLDGFAAVEAEIIVRLGVDAPMDKVDWKEDELSALELRLHIGIETAGSPLANINHFGPIVVASDFGNNAGIIVGPEIGTLSALTTDISPASPARRDSLACETWIDGKSVGRGDTAGIPGGIQSAVLFALSCCARRGYPLRAGQLISTGAITGIHDIRIGQSAEVVFDGFEPMRCRAVRRVANHRRT